MLAISIIKRFNYACNLNSETDYMCLQSFQWGPNMLAMSKIVLESRDYDVWTNLAKTNFRGLQAYLVPFETEIVDILGLNYDHHCKHI